jgi:hypothetical protein
MPDGNRRVRLYHRGRTNPRGPAHRLHVQKNECGRTELYHYRKGDDGNNIRSLPVEKVPRNIKGTNGSNY